MRLAPHTPKNKADRSLTGDEVQKVFDKVVKNLENQIGAQLR